jgi:hypothetical protein
MADNAIDGYFEAEADRKDAEAKAKEVVARTKVEGYRNEVDLHFWHRLQVMAAGGQAFPGDLNPNVGPVVDHTFATNHQELNDALVDWHRAVERHLYAWRCLPAEKAHEIKQPPAEPYPDQSWPTSPPIQQPPPPPTHPWDQKEDDEFPRG